jgi:hypothetical protein
MGGVEAWRERERESVERRREWDREEREREREMAMKELVEKGFDVRDFGIGGEDEGVEAEAEAETDRGGEMEDDRDVSAFPAGLKFRWSDEHRDLRLA